MHIIYHRIIAETVAAAVESQCKTMIQRGIVHAFLPPVYIRIFFRVSSIAKSGKFPVVIFLIQSVQTQGGIHGRGIGV